MWWWCVCVHMIAQRMKDIIQDFPVEKVKAFDFLVRFFYLHGHLYSPLVNLSRYVPNSLSQFTEL